MFFSLIFSLSFFSTEALGELPKKKIRLRGQILTVEIARTESEQARGLMFRKSLEKNSGMLFVFPNVQERSFWMKNTFIPLDIGFFDSEQRLMNFESMDPVRSEAEEPKRTYTSKGPAQYALEVNKDWFKTHELRKGDRFIFVP
jgi:uncharacterized membrane protein (UPF0127 family)